MLISENGERLYEKSDITDQMIRKLQRHYFDKGTVRGKNRTYINDFMTMDIETSTYGRLTDNPVAFTYSIAVYIADRGFIFRTWADYNWFIHTIGQLFGLNTHLRLVCYVHNLPYEFQFMRDFMDIKDVFATQPRKVVKCFASGIEYRCSYKLTNMGLARFTNNIPNVIHKKLSGEDFDYSVLRTPSSILTGAELDYIYNDVAGLYEALDYFIKHDEYNVATIPNTSTGFVRNDMRYAMSKNPQNRIDFMKMRLDQFQYGLLRAARRGGNTHCNPLYSDMEVEGLLSKDMSSGYPAVMVQCKYPMTQFMPVRTSRLTDYEYYIDAGFACILDITFFDLEVKTCATIPYIAKEHCTGFPRKKKGQKEFPEFRSDNGRVLKAEELSMVITDIDYKIIRDTYNFNTEKTVCRLCYIAKYDYLPMELRKTILKQYEDKTKLKGKDEYLYMKQKNKFNANFGCMLTDICQDTVLYQPHNLTPFKYSKEMSYQEQLDKYYSSKNSFLSYQHGVWVTAHCRNRLQKAINGLMTDMVYCDTDSVKFFDTSANRLLIDKLNEEIRKEIAECGLNCTVQYKGKDYTLGLWETDGEYKRFKSLGAKKYCYVDMDDNFSITVAGLSKSKAKDYLINKAKEENIDIMDLFEPGTIVPYTDSGRTSARYNDYDSVRSLYIKETGERVQVGSNTVIEDTTYKFGLTEEYEDLIQNMKEGVMW